MESPHNFRSQSSQPLLPLPAETLPSVGGSSKPAVAPRKGQKGPSAKAIRKLAVKDFKWLFTQCRKQLQVRNERQFRKKLYENLEICCAETQPNVRTCECASLINILQLPDGCPVSDPRPLGKAFQKLFRRGVKARKKRRSASVHTDSDPVTPCPLQTVHRDILPLVRSQRKARGTQPTGDLQSQAGKRTCGKEEDQPRQKRSKRNREGDPPINTVHLDGQSTESCGLSEAAGTTAEGQHRDLRADTWGQVITALSVGPFQAWLVIARCFIKRPDEMKPAFKQFLHGEFDHSEVTLRNTERPVEYLIADLLWACCSDHNLLELLARKLENCPDFYKTPGLAAVALGVLDAFRSSLGSQLWPDDGVVDAGSVEEDANPSQGTYMPSWMTRAPLAEGPSTDFGSDAGGSYGYSMSRSTKSTCTTVSSSLSSGMEAGALSDSADSAIARKSLARGPVSRHSGRQQGVRNVELEAGESCRPLLGRLESRVRAQSTAAISSSVSPSEATPTDKRPAKAGLSSPSLRKSQGEFPGQDRSSTGSTFGGAGVVEHALGASGRRQEDPSLAHAGASKAVARAFHPPILTTDADSEDSGCVTAQASGKSKHGTGTIPPDERLHPQVVGAPPSTGLGEDLSGENSSSTSTGPMSLGRQRREEPTVLVESDNTVVEWDKEFIKRWIAAGNPTSDADIVKTRKHLEIELNFEPEQREQVVESGIDVNLVTSPRLSRMAQCTVEKYDWVAKHLGESWFKTAVKGDILIDDKPAVKGASRDGAYEGSNLHADTSKPRAQDASKQLYQLRSPYVEDSHAADAVEVTKRASPRWCLPKDAADYKPSGAEGSHASDLLSPGLGRSRYLLQY